MSLKSLFMSCVQVLKASRYNSAENKLLKAVKCFEPLKIFLDMLLASFAALVPNVGCRAHFCRPEKYLQIDQKIFTSLKKYLPDEAAKFGGVLTTAGVATISCRGQHDAGL